MTHVIHTPSGPVYLSNVQTYSLQSLLSMDEQTVQHFAATLKIAADKLHIITILANNNLISAPDDKISRDARFYALLSQPNLQSTLSQLGMTFPHNFDFAASIVTTITTILNITDMVNKLATNTNTRAAINSIFPVSTTPTDQAKQIVSTTPTDQTNLSALSTNYSPRNEKRSHQSDLISGKQGHEYINSAPGRRPQFWLAHVIKQKRQLIANDLAEYFNTANPQWIEAKDLGYMFNLYDKYFFEGYLERFIRHQNSKIEIGFNSRLTRTIGRCSIKGCNYKMEFSRQRIADIVAADNPKDRQVGGIACDNFLSALQLTMEHEIIHLVMFLEKVDTKPHGAAFKRSLHNYFQHTQINYRLHQEEVDESDIPADQLTKKKANVDQRVQSTYKGETVRGRITKINPKRVEVTLDDGDVIVGHYSLWQMISNSAVSIATEEIAPGPLTFARARVGQHVSGMFRRKLVTGKIIKKNPKRARVQLDDGEIIVGHYNLFTLL